MLGVQDEAVGMAYASRAIERRMFTEMLMNSLSYLVVLRRFPFTMEDPEAIEMRSVFLARITLAYIEARDRGMLSRSVLHRWGGMTPTRIERTLRNERRLIDEGVVAEA